MTEEKIGIVEHYYPKAHAAAIRLQSNLHVGDRIHIRGRQEDFIQDVDSLQLDRRPIDEAYAGQSVGLQVDERVHENAEVFVLRE